MSIVALVDVQEFVDSNEDMVETLHNASEAAIEHYCRRSFTSATYTLEKYSSNGTPYINLKNYPVTAVQLISVGTRDAMYIYNTNTTSYASVSVSSTGLTLSRDGATDSSPTFASNVTLGALVTAINAVGFGWSAAIASSSYNSFKSTFLLSKMGQSVIDSNYVYLQIPNEPESDFEVDENNGIVKLSWSVPCGFKNIYATYVAGYSSTNVPYDLAYAVKILTKYFFDTYTSQTYGLDNYRIGDISYNFSSGGAVAAGLAEASIPIEVKDILAKYKKRMV